MLFSVQLIKPWLDTSIATFSRLGGQVVQQGLHRHRIRRALVWVLSCKPPQKPLPTVPNGGFAAEQIAGLRQPLAHRGFAVGAGDAHIEASPPKHVGMTFLKHYTAATRCRRGFSNL